MKMWDSVVLWWCVEIRGWRRIVPSFPLTMGYFDARQVMHMDVTHVSVKGMCSSALELSFSIWRPLSQLLEAATLVSGIFGPFGQLNAYVR